jgi:hypothetical protein
MAIKPLISDHQREYTLLRYGGKTGGDIKAIYRKY